VTLARALVLALAMITVALAVGCDPAFGLRVRQALTVRPSTACVDSALVALPLVARATRIDPRGAERQYEITLSDPTLGFPQNRIVEIAPAPGRDSATVIVSVTYHWVGSSRLPPGEERLIALGAEAPPSVCTGVAVSYRVCVYRTPTPTRCLPCRIPRRALIFGGDGGHCFGVAARAAELALATDRRDV
jgi:hypothetical protein